MLKAHKIVLCATIPYFHAMFNADMLESTMSEVFLHGIEANTLQSLINFSYSGKIVIDTGTVHSLMLGASYFQLTRVRDACAIFLSERLQICNVLGTSKFADTLSCSTLVVACEKYIHQYFHEVSLCDEFSNLLVKEVAHLLSSDELNVSSEEQVFEALMRWVKKDPRSREEHLPGLLSKIRLPLLSPEYLIDNVAKEELIKSSHECRELVDEAKDYHLIPKRRFLLQSFKTQPQCCMSVSSIIFAIGGLFNSGSLTTVESYDPRIGKWSLTESMTTAHSDVNVAVLNKCLYAIGGYGNSQRLNTVEVFESSTNTWHSVSSMNYRRSAGGATALKDKLYVCGGYNGTNSLNSVECYDPELNIWTLTSPMVKLRSFCGVIASDGYLYALGGYDRLTVFDLVERYDPNTEIWTEVTPMLTKRCRLGVASLNGKLYACGGYDPKDNILKICLWWIWWKCMILKITSKWRMIAPMNTKRSRVALITNMGKLWAIGGYDGVSYLSTVEIYDPQLDEWVFGPSMCAHEGGVRVGAIPLS